MFTASKRVIGTEINVKLKWVTCWVSLYMYTYTTLGFSIFLFSFFSFRPSRSVIKCRTCVRPAESQVEIRNVSRYIYIYIQNLLNGTRTYIASGLCIRMNKAGWVNLHVFLFVFLFFEYIYLKLFV